MSNSVSGHAPPIELAQQATPYDYSSQNQQQVNKADLSIQSISSYLKLSYIFLAILVLVVGGWAYFSQIQGAVVVQGSIGVEGKPKTIQHLNGGVISEILVREGDFISKGDALLKLDSTILDASQISAETNFYENEALISRLMAEKSGRSKIKWSSELASNEYIPRVKLAMQGQSQIFRARQSALNGQVGQLRLHITQLQEEITGVESEISYVISEHGIVAQELNKLRVLLQQNLVSQDRITSLERDKFRLENDLAKLKTRRETNILSIRETHAEISQHYRLRQEEILTDLRTAQTQADTYSENLKIVSSKSGHVIIKAPISGLIHNMTVTTIGGVIVSGQELMQIVPTNGKLILQAKLQPQDVDQVSIGQNTKIIFSNLNQKTSPELNGTVQYISANSLIDQVSGMPYYAVEIIIDNSERAKLNGQQLIPGMPADIFIQTESRSVLNYLLSPLKKVLNKTMREA